MMSCVWSVEISRGICLGISSPGGKGGHSGGGTACSLSCPNAQRNGGCFLVQVHVSPSPPLTHWVTGRLVSGTVGSGSSPEVVSPLSASGWPVHCPPYSSVGVTTV